MVGAYWEYWFLLYIYVLPTESMENSFPYQSYWWKREWLPQKRFYQIKVSFIYYVNSIVHVSVPFWLIWHKFIWTYTNGPVWSWLSVTDLISLKFLRRWPGHLWSHWYSLFWIWLTLSVGFKARVNAPLLLLCSQLRIMILMHGQGRAWTSNL